ncbi:M20 family metallopeptidase [Paenalcaligenes sp.]|uniref:M20 family metallopeptidase n=1 Tax=Paenalcaligenes sp. TaxID=1966342 RepID=UPI002636D7A1|nr:M20 family metallopeptidase [Paenalcaligenes sp.]
MNHQAHELTEALRQQIIRWVELESPSHDADALRAMAALILDDIKDSPLRVEQINVGEDTGPILHIHNRADNDSRSGILVLGHYDTVHPIGTLTQNPCRQEGDKLFGPGIYDMKSGVVLALSALKALAQPQATQLPVDLVLVPDEETGSHYSREYIEKFAKKSVYTLVCEPARVEEGRCVTARKGTGNIFITAHGRPAHAGIHHEKGRNAIEEIAHHVLALEKLTDYERGITVSVGVIKGGTTSNVVPAWCQIKADFRVPNAEMAQRLEQQVQQIKAIHPDIRLEVEFKLNRPAMPRTEATAALLAQCQNYARQAGFELKEAPMTGGASDANFTAALGVPTLDGLGADGNGAHTLNEHILVSTLAQRRQFWLHTLAQLH